MPLPLQLLLSWAGLAAKRVCSRTVWPPRQRHAPRESPRFWHHEEATGWVLPGRCLRPALQPARHRAGERHKAPNQVEPQGGRPAQQLPGHGGPEGGDAAAPGGLHQARPQAGYRLRSRGQQVLRGQLLAVPRRDPLQRLLRGQRDPGEVCQRLHQRHPGCEPGGAVPGETGQPASPAHPVAAGPGALLRQALRFLVGKRSGSLGRRGPARDALPAGFHLVHCEISLQAGGQPQR